MKKLLAEIQDGSFAKKFMEENRTGRHQFEKYRTAESAHLIEKVGTELRAAMPFLDPITAPSQSPEAQEATTTA
jgi:ketol-acid reductoisomerase